MLDLAAHCSSPADRVQPLRRKPVEFLLRDFDLVLWARLELARLAPLPPQDSVSTNSTTRAPFE